MSDFLTILVLFGAFLVFLAIILLGAQFGVLFGLSIGLSRLLLTLVAVVVAFCWLESGR